MDEVHIKSIEDKIAGQWAQEKSLKELISVAKKLQATAAKSTKEGNKELKDAESKTKEFGKSAKTSSSVMGKFTTKVTDSVKSLGNMNFVAGALAGVLGAVFSTVKQGSDVARSIYSSGLTFSSINAQGERVANTFATMTNMAAGAGLSFDQLGGILQESGKAIEMFGVEQFMPAAKSMKTAGHDLGRSFEQTSEFLGEYLERQRLLGTLDSMDRVKAAQQAAESMKVSQGFAQALRMSTEEFEKQLKAQSESIDGALAVASLPSHVQEAAMQMATAAGQISPGLQQMLYKGMQDLPSLIRDPQFQELMKVGGPAAEQMLETIQGFQAGTITDGPKAMANLMKSFEKVNDQTVSMYMQRGVISRETAGIVVNAQRMNKVLDQNTGNYEAATDANAQARAKFDTTMDAARTAFTNSISSMIERSGIDKKLPELMNSFASALESLVSSGVLPFITGALTTFGNVLGSVIDGLSALTNWLGWAGNEGTEGGTADAASALGAVVATVVTTIIASGLVLKIVKAVSSAIGTAKSLFGGAGAVADIGGGKGGGKGGKGLGKGAAMFGAGTGKAIQLFGAGLRAFPPQAVLGAGALALSIGMIGGIGTAVLMAFSEATRMMGEALPVLSQGVQSFQDIDGEKISSAGNAIVDLAKGLAGLGEVSVGDAFASFFGAGITDQIEKFTELSDLGPAASNLNKLGTASINLANGLSKLDNINIKKIVKGLDSFSDLDDKDMKRINQLSKVNTTGIFGPGNAESNSDTMKTLIDLTTQQNEMLAQLLGVNMDQYKVQRKANNRSAYFAAG